MNQKEIGLFILKKRKELGLTQKDLADKINVSPKTISKWERGRGLPDVGYLLPLAENLNITVNELLQGTEKDDVTVKTVKYYTKKAIKKSVLITFIISIIIFPIIFLTINECTNSNYLTYSNIRVNIETEKVLKQIINKDYKKLDELLIKYNNGRFTPRSMPSLESKKLIENLKELDRFGITFKKYKLINTFNSNVHSGSNYKLYYTYKEKEYYLYITVAHTKVYSKYDISFYAYNDDTNDEITSYVVEKFLK